MPSDRFHMHVRAEGFALGETWEVLRVVFDQAHELFKEQVHGAWLVEFSGRTSDSRHFERKNIQQLREAFESARATPLGLDVMMRPTIGWAAANLVLINVWFGTRPYIEVRVSGRDRQGVQTFVTKVSEHMDTSRTVKSVATGLMSSISKLTVTSSDRGRGKMIGGTLIPVWVAPTVITVVGGVAVLVIAKALNIPT